jgi:DNA invertase Pin-like site-specific DNA recombinase
MFGAESSMWFLWLVDRFARSVSHLLRGLEEFSHMGVDFVSVSESIDTSTPMGKMIFTVLGAVAELERNLIKERVQMGISRAREQGKALGRPLVEIDPLQFAGLRARGLSWNQIAEKLGVGRGTAERAFRSLSQKPLRNPTNFEHIQ